MYFERKISISIFLFFVLFFICSCELGQLFHNCTFDQKVPSSLYIAEEANCEDPACYYYSCKCGKKDSKTFFYGKPLGHSYDDYSCMICGSKNPEICELKDAESIITMNSDSGYRRFFYKKDLYTEEFVLSMQDYFMSMSDLNFKLYSTFSNNKLSDKVPFTVDDTLKKIKSNSDNLDGTFFFLISLPEPLTQLTADLNE